MSWKSSMFARAGIVASLSFTALSFSDVASAKPFLDYIKPRPVTCALSSATWGVNEVLPRDLCNGMESVRGAGIGPEYYYWDGQIIKAPDGRYHLFMSTWAAQTNSFNPGWLDSDAYHAVSDQGVLGPYQRQGYIYDNNGSHKGHNVTAVELPDGGYAVVVSETVPFTIYTSDSLDGPWTSCQPQIDVASSNVSLFPRHDGRFQIVERYGAIAIADTLCGHYVKQRPTCSYPTDNGDTIYPTRTSIPNVPNPTFDWQEDPHIWRSGGTYHVIYSGSGDRVGWHVYSADGINDWQDNGYGWSPRDYDRLFCFEGTDTCNQWYKMERPGVVLENGHPTHITWAVADVDKDNQIPANSNHGSKIIVVPFDGVAFDNDFGDGSVGGAGGTGGTGTGGDGGMGATGGAAIGGGAGVGGVDAAGGTQAVGGTGGTSAGGSMAAGGTAPSIGGTMSGGTTAVGGAAGSAGVVAVGGTVGGSDPMGLGGTAPVTTGAAPEPSGCACHIAGRGSNLNLLALLGMVGLLGAGARRRRPSRR